MNINSISIITPSYNQADFIEDTLRSVRKQTYPAIEHLILDGGSDDETVNILEQFETETADVPGYTLEWTSEPDEGQSHGINKGFERASGEIVGWLNSDDVYFYRDTVERMVEALEARPEVDVLYGDHVEIGRDGEIRRVRRALDWDYDRLRRSYSIPQPATFFRDHVVADRGLDTDLDYSMDLEYWLYLGRRYRFEHVPYLVAGNRMYPENKRTAGDDAHAEESARVRRAYGGPEPVPTARRFGDVARVLWTRLAATSRMLAFEADEPFAFDASVPSRAERLSTQLDLRTLAEFLS
ncbi:glycosyltransferase [Halobacteriales archaeon QS_5_70_15]|nr:MAG: glycosyltransferase [Halobacteriales archaeon QS_5_70_15]